MTATFVLMPDVVLLYSTSGECKDILKIAAADTEAFSAVIARLKSLADSFCIFTTNMALEDIKNTTRLPLNF